MIFNRFLFGKILRLPLRLIPKDSVLPIVSGVLIGKKWIFGSGVAGYWLGIYEKEEQRLLAKLIKKGDVFFDIGANVGFYSLLTSKLVGPNGQVVSFEPDTDNFIFLKKHIEINKVKNIIPFNFAISDFNGESAFKRGINNATGKLVKEASEFSVKTFSLDSFCKDKKIYPNCLKIDVEGSEVEVLLGAKSMISENHPILVVATHSGELFLNCKKLIEGWGYTIESLPSKMEQNRDIVAIFRK